LVSLLFNMFLYNLNLLIQFLGLFFLLQFLSILHEIVRIVITTNNKGHLYTHPYAVLTNFISLAGKFDGNRALTALLKFLIKFFHSGKINFFVSKQK